MEICNKKTPKQESEMQITIKYSRRCYINTVSKKVSRATRRKNKSRIADNVLYFIETDLINKKSKLTLSCHENSITLDEREIVRLIDVLNHQIREWK